MTPERIAELTAIADAWERAISAVGNLNSAVMPSKLLAGLREALAEVERLRAALKPFAEIVEDLRDDMDDDDLALITIENVKDGNYQLGIDMGDCRRAAKLLAPAPVPPPA